MDDANSARDENAVLDLDGANCPSCAYTIERLGRKVDGVRDVRVDTRKRQVSVTYGGDPASLEKIVEIVRRLGYDAIVR